MPGPQTLMDPQTAAPGDLVPQAPAGGRTRPSVPGPPAPITLGALPTSRAVSASTSPSPFEPRTKGPSGSVRMGEKNPDKGSSFAPIASKLPGEGI
jgi:hypothetical protein